MVWGTAKVTSQGPVTSISAAASAERASAVQRRFTKSTRRKTRTGWPGWLVRSPTTLKSDCRLTCRGSLASPFNWLACYWILNLFEPPLPKRCIKIHRNRVWVTGEHEYPCAQRLNSAS